MRVALFRIVRGIGMSDRKLPFDRQHRVIRASTLNAQPRDRWKSALESEI
jgi:hypothetical protein